MATQATPTKITGTIPVTADNFIRAESDWYLGNFVKRSGLGWNYMVRLYRPRAEILDGTWKFTEAKALS